MEVITGDTSLSKTQPMAVDDPNDPRVDVGLIGRTRIRFSNQSAERRAGGQDDRTVGKIRCDRKPLFGESRETAIPAESGE